MISVGFARVSKKRPYRICGKISFYDPRNSHFMTDEFHFMTYKFHLMTEPTAAGITRSVKQPKILLNERSFSIMHR